MALFFGAVGTTIKFVIGLGAVTDYQRIAFCTTRSQFIDGALEAVENELFAIHCYLKSFVINISTIYTRLKHKVPSLIFL